jgi:TRAP-type C4-dicarboxylate transport system substrate-binding protein
VGIVTIMGRRPSLSLVVVSAALIVPATACSGSSADKAGGSRRAETKPVTLTLFTGDNLFAPEYAAAVARLSGGAMRIRITVGGNQPDYERGTVRYVRSGGAQLGSVGARVWDTMGVTSLRALVAPFLVDSLALEERVLESPRIARMLEGVDRAGVVGLAVLPGPLRRPLGLSRPLIGPEDYRGAMIAIRYGDVARTTFAALGAATEGYNVGVLPAAADGAELDVNTIGLNTFDARAKGLTSNVVFWARPQTVFANRQAFQRLTPAQRQILRRAGREALAPEIARVAKEEQAALTAICGRGTLALARASATDLAALRRAVQPVYAKLNKDSFTKDVIREITRLRAARPADVVECPAASRAGAASRLEGGWQAASSREDLLAAGTPPNEAERQSGVATLELHRGQWIARERHTGFVWRGPYAVKGDILYLTIAYCRGSKDVCFRGTAEYKWSRYRDRLTLARLSGSPTYYGVLAKPLTRLR